MGTTRRLTTTFDSPGGVPPGEPPGCGPPGPDPARGWPDGLVALFSVERVGLTRLAHVICGSNAVAEEIVQEAFVRVGVRWDEVDSPGGYLRTAVVNLARDHLRRREVEKRHAASTPPDATEASRTGDPELDETWAVVRRLPERQQAVLALRFYEDLPLAEIARILGCRLGTVKSAIHRGLATLREELS
jgi:RNA polymerase sigma-70 factor (sigma-E family)